MHLQYVDNDLLLTALFNFAVRTAVITFTRFTTGLYRTYFSTCIIYILYNCCSKDMPCKVKEIIDLNDSCKFRTKMNNRNAPEMFPPNFNQHGGEWIVSFYLGQRCVRSGLPPGQPCHLEDRLTRCWVRSSELSVVVKTGFHKLHSGTAEGEQVISSRREQREPHPWRFTYTHTHR